MRNVIAGLLVVACLICCGASMIPAEPPSGEPWVFIVESWYRSHNKYHSESEEVESVDVDFGVWGNTFAGEPPVPDYDLDQELILGSSNVVDTNGEDGNDWYDNGLYHTDDSSSTPLESATAMTVKCVGDAKTTTVPYSLTPYDSTAWNGTFLISGGSAEPPSNIIDFDIDWMQVRILVPFTWRVPEDHDDETCDVVLQIATLNGDYYTGSTFPTPFNGNWEDLTSYDGVTTNDSAEGKCHGYGYVDGEGYKYEESWVVTIEDGGIPDPPAIYWFRLAIGHDVDDKFSGHAYGSPFPLTLPPDMAKP
jgi:hypothetical protein